MLTPFELMSLKKRLQALSQDEVDAVVDRIIEKDLTPTACPSCGEPSESKQIIRKGYNRNGAQRYFYKTCDRLFVASANTARANSRKSVELWRHFAAMTVRALPLAKCAKECNLAFQTAYDWRHKIIQALQKENEVLLDGISSSDFAAALSHKGHAQK